MKKAIRFTLVVFFLVGLSSSVFAQEVQDQETKKLNFDIQSVAKATRVIQQNPEIFRNPELLKRYANLARVLKNRK